MAIFSSEPEAVQVRHGQHRKKRLTRKRYQADLNVVPEPKKSYGCSIPWWSCFAHAVTWWAPAFLLKCCGMKDREVRQAFREKIALCFLILLLCACLAFVTFGLGLVLCPKYDARPRMTIRELRANPGQNRTWMQGFVFDAAKFAKSFGIDRMDVMDRDIGGKFPPTTDSCQNVFQLTYTPICRTLNNCLNRNQLYYEVKATKKVIYDWEQIRGSKSNLIVYDGEVWDLSELMNTNNNWFADEQLGREILRHLGNDITPTLARRGKYGGQVAECLSSWFKVGDLSTKTMGCMTHQLLTALILFAIVSLILTKFIMAVCFSWFMSRRLDRMKHDQDVGEKRELTSQDIPDLVLESFRATLGIDTVAGLSTRTSAPPGTPFVLMFVPCYSEGEESIRVTLDSLAVTDYHDRRKVIFMVADGIITGKGNEQSTPDIALHMLEMNEDMMDPQPMSYISVEDGEKQHNMAKVYVGIYTSNGRKIPTVLVVKCGTPAEASSPKPGNRGKRDSQMILMNFMQHIIFNESMSPLEYDLFNKMYWLLGVPPDWFSYVLMVDADTRVAVDSLRRMINAMIRDPKVIGLCGETRIANKWQSWVTMIQVFEYYISHHLGKAFESVFGGVTCLPGCFSMYRIKSLKDGHWLPILVHPKIVDEYSTGDVDTLHKKNLLLLGEDRFLTTLLIKTFPNRKLIFVPQAYAHTIVPHEFRVLLSQRRRWINSTLHNLLELVQLNNLCGIFCFSMQFVVFIELIATVVLPAAIVLTIVMIVTAAMNPSSALIPLILLSLVLGMPAVLIVLTSFNLRYLFWMLVYLIALPIWNFVLPLYAYWHFDDFSWGKTHRIAKNKPGKKVVWGEIDDNQDDDEDDDLGKRKQVDEFDEEVPMKTWIAWTRHFIRQAKYQY